MVTISCSNSQPANECRRRVTFALQAAYSGHRYSSPALFDAVQDFVRCARHGGLSLEWVLIAMQDLIDAGILPSLPDSERTAFSMPILRIAAEAYQQCSDAPEARDPCSADEDAARTSRTVVGVRGSRALGADLRL